MTWWSDRLETLEIDGTYYRVPVEDAIFAVEELERLEEEVDKLEESLREERMDNKWLRVRLETKRLRDALEDIAGYTGRSWAKDKARKALGWDDESGGHDYEM